MAASVAAVPLVEYQTEDEALAAETAFLASNIDADLPAAERTARSLSQFFEESDLDKAQKYIQTTLEIIEKRAGTQSNGSYAAALVDLAYTNMRQRRVAESKAVLERARAIEDSLGLPHLSTMPLAKVVSTMGDLDEAERLLTAGIEEQKLLPVGEQSELAAMYSHLAMVRMNKDETDPSTAELLDKSIAACVANNGEASTETASAYVSKAGYCKMTGNMEGAISSLQTAMAAFAAAGSPEIMQCTNMLVSLLLQNGRKDEAIAALDVLLNTITTQLGAAHPMVQNVKSTIDAIKSGKPLGGGHGHGHSHSHGGGHGHSHGGQPCHGHGHGPAELEEDADDDDLYADPAASHGHSHGGQPCHGHGGAAAAAAAPAHGHSHGGQPCHGHGGADVEAAPAHGHSHGGQPCHGHGGAEPGQESGCIIA